MFKVIFLKIKHQPFLLGVLTLVIGYGLLIVWKMRSSPDNSDIWFKNGLVYLNCLTPFFFFFIIAIQRKFEDHRPNFYSVLSSPSRTKWLLAFSLGAYTIWLMNLLTFSLLFWIFTKVPFSEYVNLWVSEAFLGMIWVPIIEYFGIIHSYLASIVVGVMTIPFTIYYGTTQLGIDLWRMIPWVYSIKIYLIPKSQLIWMILVILTCTLLEQLLVNWCFNNWTGR